MRKGFYRVFAVLAVFCLTLGLFTNVIPVQAATVWGDVSSTHWARGPIYSWTNQGLVGGYSDGTFRPSQLMTKAEFITFVNRGFGFREMAAISFPDVKPNAWYAGDIRKAVAQGYAEASDPGLFEPNKPISRLESMTMLYKVLRLQPAEQDYLSGFKDASTLTGIARDVMNTAVAEGYIGGYIDNTVRPSGTLTRAEMIAILSRVVGTRYAAAGAFGPDLGTAIVNGNVTIPVTGVTLRNTLVKGDLYITEGVGDGEVTLNSVKVEGRTIFAGGGGHSINNTGTTELPHVIIADPNGDVHVVFMDDATSNLISWQSGGTYDSTSGQNRPSILLSSSIPAGSTVKFVGNFDVIDVAAPNITVEVSEGSQSNTVQVQPSANGSTLALGGTVETINMQAEATLNVTGTVTALNVESAAIINVAETATVETIATTDTATGANLTLAGTVNSVQLNAETTVTVAETATITTVSASETAAGSSVTIAGEVTDLQTSAPLSVELQAGATLTNLTLEEGAAGTELTTAEGVTPPTVTAPPTVTWSNNGEDQTGSTVVLPPTGGGGGGGGFAPMIISAAVLDENGSAIPGSGYNVVGRTVDLRSLADTVRVSGVTITCLPEGTSITLKSIVVRGQAIDGFDSVTYDTPATIDMQALMGEYGALIELLLETSGEDFDGDVSLGMMRALLGESITVVGLLNEIFPATVRIELGAPQGDTIVPTPWVDATVDGRVIDATIVQSSTQLSGNLHTLIGAVSLVGLDNVIPTRIAVDPNGNWYDPNNDADVDGFKAELVAEVGVDWSVMTMGDLPGNTIYFKVNPTDVDYYTVNFR